MACLLLVLLIGLAVGGSAGLLGGRADRGLMRIAELFMTFPTSILSFFMVGVLGTGLTNVILAIALSHWAWYARMVRNLVVSLRQREFILAARLSGASQWRLFSDHLAGAVIPSLLVLASLDIGHMMLHVAGMSFPRSRRQRADGGMGGDDQRRPAVYLDPAAANGLAGAGAVHQRDGF